MALRPGPAEDICSARDCEVPARWALTWQNPRLPYGRTKTWLTCEDHRAFLHSYLAYRSFPVREEPFCPADKEAEAAPEATPPPPHPPA